MSKNSMALYIKSYVVKDVGNIQLSWRFSVGNGHCKLLIAYCPQAQPSLTPTIPHQRRKFLYQPNRWQWRGCV